MTNDIAERLRSAIFNGITFGLQDIGLSVVFSKRAVLTRRVEHELAARGLKVVLIDETHQSEGEKHQPSDTALRVAVARIVDEAAWLDGVEGDSPSYIAECAGRRQTNLQQAHAIHAAYLAAGWVSGETYLSGLNYQHNLFTNAVVNLTAERDTLQRQLDALTGDKAVEAAGKAGAKWLQTKSDRHIKENPDEWVRITIAAARDVAKECAT